MNDSETDWACRRDSELRNVYTLLVGRPKEKKERRYKENIKTENEINLEVMNPLISFSIRPSGGLL
jgi:hypothetical protein